MRLAWWIAGPAIVLGSFFGTLQVVDAVAPDFNGPSKRNAIRAQHAELLKTAIGKYKAATGSYPNYPDNAVDDLSKELVGRGYLTAIPQEPLRAQNNLQYRYSTTGPAFGLLFHLENSDRKFERCRTGVRAAGSGMWGEPKECAF